MNLLNLEHVSKAFVSRPILDDVTVGIEDTDKIGLVGVNGTGKSTFLEITAGVLEPDDGQVIKGKDVRISYLSQNPVFDESISVMENVAAMVSGKEAHWDVSGEAKARLIDFGIPDPNVSPKTLSGGQKKRAALIAAILTPCDLLILDEPTNHLDGRMIEWLEDYLRSYRGALLMVTHDRYFLDRVTNQILELDKGKTYRYKENYSRYLELKEQRLNDAIASERKMAQLYKQDLKWMMRGARARSTKQKAHIQRFEALRDRKKIVEERQLELDSLSSRIGNKTIVIENISKSFGDRLLFRNFTYLFRKTDRIGIIGPNGCGKSTLLKCMIGEELPDSGSIEIGQTIKIGYFGQENEILRENERVIDFVKETAEFVRTSDGLVSASNMCERFLFDSEMQYSVIEKLSGGEKRRLSLLKVLMSAPNVLILDEPTNDLDIQTLQVLEDYLDRFAGIVIVVSHDRYFLDRVVTRIFSFQSDGSLWQSEGGYTEYREHCQQSGRDLLFAPKTTSSNSGNSSAEKANGDLAEKAAAGNGESEKSSEKIAAPQKRKQNKLSYKDQREYDTIEDEIAKLEEESADLEKQIMASASSYTKLEELTKQKEAVDAKLDERLERFIELQELVESFS
jgi:ABC transport system ATP-binding/permease protein